MIECTVERSVAVPCERLLDWFVPRTPVGLFNSWGPIPGVSAVVDQSGPWTTRDSRRRLRLADGGEVEERVLGYVPPREFSYRMTGFAGVMRPLVDHVDGRWEAVPADASSTRVRWTYTFADRGLAARFALHAMMPAWRGYMRASIRRVAEAAETETRAARVPA